MLNSMKIFDNHCHISFAQPVEESVSGFEKVIKELHISEIGALSCPRSPHVEGEVDCLENLKILYLKERLSVPVYAYAGFVQHYNTADAYLQFAKDMLDMGFDGFKTLEQHPGIRKKVGKGLCDPSFDDFFEYIGNRKKPIVCHVGDPRLNWNVSTASESAKELGRIYDDESFLSLDELYDEMEEVLRKHPEVPIILAHFYFKADDYDGLVRLMDTYPNMYLDFTPGSAMFPQFSEDIATWRKFFIKYQQRLIMGSDLYAAGYGVNRHQLVRRFLETTEPFEAKQKGKIIIPVNLPQEILENIYYNNVKRLFGSKPKSVNRQKAYAYCLNIANQYMDQLSDTGRQNLEIFLKFWKER